MSEPLRSDDLTAVVAALAGREMVVVAPHGTVNTGVVAGGQRQTSVGPAEGSGTAAPMRQGPVRADRLKAARRCFVPPPGFETALAAIDSGIVVLVGEPGSGRETHALNLLAHGREEPVLVQVDGADNISRWGTRGHGVHGYLVMECPDPLALRAWDMAGLEGRLAEVRARLILVLSDAPGLVAALEDNLGVPVVRHLPPDPRQVFSAHLSDGCSDAGACAAWLRSLEPGQHNELLPDGLPPRQAAQAAQAVLRLGVASGVSSTEAERHLARNEGPEIFARAQAEPALLAHLLSLCVYGGMSPDVMQERAADLLRLLAPSERRELDIHSPRGLAPGDVVRSSSAEILRALGAHRVRRPGTESADTVAFFWPTVAETVWGALCRDRSDLLPLLHFWLAHPGHESEQVERAGRGAAAIAAATAGRSLTHLRHLASAASPAAPLVAAWCLGTAASDPTAGRKAAELLDRWSVAAEEPLRSVVAHACHPDCGRVTAVQALPLLRQLIETQRHDGNMSLIGVVLAVLVRQFETGDSEARAAVLSRMCEWARSDGSLGLVAALVCPEIAGADLAWWSEQVLSGAELASCAAELVGHALDEPVAFPFIRDALIDWAAEADGTKDLARALDKLLDALVEARKPGFLRWLLAMRRGSDGLPGKELAARALAELRGDAAAPNTY
ncbi:hypothetical protein [Streptomyces rochei]|uniref:hypothetical protein n=1 Tax=Streptomyces rochei TaxID=1928 RepID=UPI0022E9CEA7|nr:hypothetical protein [Streptomyces rochei]MCC8455093.1 hypothetical protein [Streptomyces rochei]